MKATFHGQTAPLFAALINSLAGQYNRVFIATAFLTADGLKKLEAGLKGKDVRIVCGVHGCVSDLWALKDFLGRNAEGVEARVCLGSNVFHSKLYLFTNEREGAMLVGSPNLTSPGLSTNEEICLEIIGKTADEPLDSAIKYFADLWTTRTVSVQKYLELNPDYHVERARHEATTDSEETLFAKLRREIAGSLVFSFKRNVIDTFYTLGRQTIPIEYNDLMAGISQTQVRHSAPFEIFLPDHSPVKGKIRWSRSSWGRYYEIGLGTQQNVSRMQALITRNDALDYQVDLSKRTVRIIHVRS